MATSYTSNAGLSKPGTNDTGWGTTLNTTLDAVDTVPAVGWLAVTTKETPSTTLNVKVAAGTFAASTGAKVVYAGTASQAVTLSTTSYVYLTDAGTLTTNTSGFPAATWHVPLAVVVAGASTITSVTDVRVPFAVTGMALPASAAQAAVATTSATQSSPWGFSTQAQADGVITLLNRLRTDLITQGQIKGSA